MAHLHAIDGLLPTLQIFDFILPTYYLVISFAFCVCLIWLVSRARARDFDIKLVIDSALVIMLASFVGARLMHVVFEDFDFYRANPLDILKFWNGGYVFYGGLFGAFFCVILFLRMNHQSIGEWANLYAPVTSLGYAIGRFACFLTGCCYGEACELFVPYEFRHPTQLYAIATELLTLVILLKIENKKMNPVPGFLFSIWLILHSLGRIFMELLRADPRGPMPFSISISTWISLIILVLTGIYLQIQFKRVKT